MLKPPLALLRRAAGVVPRRKHRSAPIAAQVNPDQSPEVQAFFFEADELSRVFERRRGRRFPLVGLALTAALLFFGAGYGVRAAFFETSAETSVASGHQQDPAEAQRLLDEIAPAGGFTVEARWGDLLPQLVEAGVIDVAKFKEVAQRSGAPLTEDQLRLLSTSSDEKLSIDRDNTYFILNVLWAVGLANADEVLSQGPMAQAGEQAGRLASTAGWRLGQKPGPDYLGSLQLITLTPEQEQIVQHVAAHSYRPCCNNPTAFPDCNHGAAALGLAEIMASQGASAEEIFSAVKAFNAYWFPQAYYKLAVFFDGQGTDWQDVDAEMVVGREYSSQAGASQVDAQLRAQGSLPQIQGGAGGSCAQ